MLSRTMILREILKKTKETLCRKGTLKALAYDWKLNRAIEYISRSWSFLLIFMFVLRFVLHKTQDSRQTERSLPFNHHCCFNHLIETTIGMNGRDYRMNIGNENDQVS
ncbi:hypothetical protein [Bartonella massiliensis]|uniref:hypothetical protein n=1 Tax=Bartonella massiliensis TaxID=929795 RepID=UPI00163B926B|nr:hypothetical protein [Bartonella massiliensis]